jgi:predicted aldo/keto reductase-like oxidoreductase
MKYRLYGNTGKKISAFGFGATYPGHTLRDEDDFEKCVQLAIAANEKGINYFDTAHKYAHNKSWHILRCAFKHMKNEFFVSTKSNYYDDPNADALRRRLESALKTLDIKKINFFHLWAVKDIDEYKNIRKPGGPLEGALKAKNEGLIEHLCFSAHCTGEEVEEIVNEGYFDGVTIGYNILNANCRERGIIAAHDKGLGVAVMNPLGGGMIPKNPDVFSYIKEFPEDSVSMAALRFLLNKKEITLTLTGVSTLEELNENIAIIDDGKKLNNQYFERIKLYSSLKFASFCTGCRYCQGCPENLEIHKLMMEYDRYALLFNKDPGWLFWCLKINWGYSFTQTFQCQACGICEKKCTQHLPIVSRIKEINDIIVNIRNIMKYIRPGVGIYGTGAVTKDLLAWYEDIYGEINFDIYFFESNCEKWGTIYKEKFKIYSPENIITLGVKNMIIASRIYYKEIYKMWNHLEKNGIKFIFPY